MVAPRVASSFGIGFTSVSRLPCCHASSLLPQYKFTVKQVSDCAGTRCPTLVFRSPNVTGLFTGLLPGTTYSVTVFGVDPKGEL